MKRLLDAGEAHFDSALLPSSEAFDLYGDQVAAAVGLGQAGLAFRRLAERVSPGRIASRIRTLAAAFAALLLFTATALAQGTVRRES